MSPLSPSCTMFYFKRRVRQTFIVILFFSALNIVLLLYTFGDRSTVATVFERNHRRFQNFQEDRAFNANSVTRAVNKVIVKSTHPYQSHTIKGPSEVEGVRQTKVIKRPSEVAKPSKDIIVEGVRQTKVIKRPSEVAKSSKDVIDKTVAHGHQSDVIKKLRGVGNPVVHGDKRFPVVKGHGGHPLTAFGVLVKPRANAKAKWSLGNANDTCPPKPENLEGNIFTYKDAPNFESMMRIYKRSGLEPGGHYHPPRCRARHRVAIIIPYRDRQNHLHVLLSNLHPMLMKQEIDYFILVVEMALPTQFNRGLLLNIGAVEALGLWDVHCFIFHDVDLIPENDHNLYTCPDHFRHMSGAIDKFNYTLIYDELIGGVSAINKTDFYRLNGFSNLFFGWGGEDTQFFHRMMSVNMTWERVPMSVGRYWMFRHPIDKLNPYNGRRFRLVKAGLKRQPKDGLNSLKYQVVDVEFRSGYTWILVSVNKTSIR